jgi:hypothetical protein
MSETSNTGRLRIACTGWAGDQVTVPLMAEVISLKGDWSRRVPIQGTADVQVPAGEYLVRCRLPSGDTLRAHAVVAEGEQQGVEINVGATGRGEEGLEAAELYLPRLPVSGSGESTVGERLIGFSDGRAAASATELSFRGMWMRLWVQEGDTWSLAAGLPSPQTSNGGATFRFRTGSRQQRFLQVGGPGVAWRLVAVPPTARMLEGRVRFGGPAAGGAQQATVDLVEVDWPAETLLRYLVRGDMAGARTVSGTVLTGVALEGVNQEQFQVNQAEQLIEAKVRDPLAAAIGGYYLLRTGDLARFHGWPANLDNWFEWLPDGAVIHAWQLLQQAKDQPAAELRLIEATRRGLPIYTEGLRLLWEALRLLAAPAVPDATPSVNTPGLQEALAHVRPYASATDWTQALTTFFGEDPTHPSIKPELGIPEDRENLVWFVNA